MLMRRLTIALILILLFSFSAFAVDMSVETVDEGSTQGYHSSLVIDGNGNPHISFKANSQILKYAYFDGNEWVTQNVAEGSSYINQTSIALDSEGHPCIAFQRGVYPDSSIMFTSFNGSTWDTVTVDQGYSGTGNTLSLAFDNNGDPGIAYVYYDQSDSSILKFAKRENSSWVQDTVNSDDNFHSNKCTLAFSSTGVPFIGYGYFTDTSYYGDDCKMYYSWLDETGEWQMELVDDPMIKTAYQTSTMALDTNDNPHFVYSAIDDDYLRYAFKNGESFSFLTVENADRIGNYSSLVIDDENVPHLAYCAFSGESDLKYGVLSGDFWVTSVADSQGDVGTFPSIALDPSGNPCVSYLEADDYDLQYACKNGEEWDVQTVPIEGKRRGSYPEIALDSTGEPSLVYMLQGTRAMLFASKNGNEWEKSTIMSFEDLDASYYLRDPSYIIDENDTGHLLFVSNDVLAYAVRSSDEWAFETVSSDITCRECDLALDSSVGPHVAFNLDENLDIPNGMSSAQYTKNLWYGTKVDSEWKFERIDIGRMDKIDMVLSNDEKAFICYFDDNEDELKYCVQNEVSWDIGVVSSDLSYVNSLSLEIDPSGTPHLVFVTMNRTSDSVPLKGSEAASYSYVLSHAIYNGENWTVEKIDDLKFGGDVRQIKMVFDSLGNPQIIYGTGSFGMQDGSDMDPDIKAELKYAWFDGESWKKVMLDENYLTSFASYSTVVLDSNGIPHIAYFTGNGLNYATLEFENPASSGGGNCNVGAFPAAFGLLMMPLFFLLRR